MFTDVLWSGAFIVWVAYLSQWKIDPLAWTDCGFGYDLYSCGAQYSSVLLGAMSAEKFFALYFPLKAKSYCTVGTAKWVTFLALTIAGLNVPSLIWYKYVDGKHCFMTKHGNYILMTHTMLYSVIPIVVMLLANTAIIYKLMYIKYKGISHTNQSVSKSSTRGSVMVVTVSVAFIILTFPRSVDAAIQLKISADPFGRLFVLSTQYLNHSINSILYCIFGQRFRDELWKFIFRKKKLQTSSTNMTSALTDTVTVNSL